jgi:N-acetylneuraminate lyase
MRRFEEGELEEAERLQYLAVRFVKLLERHAPLHTSLKAVLKIIGLDCGGVRLPQQPLAEGAEDAIRRDLEELGLMDWIVTVS